MSLFNHSKKQHGYHFSYIASIGGNTTWHEKVLYTSRAITVESDIGFIKGELSKDCGAPASAITITDIFPLQGGSA